MNARIERPLGSQYTVTGARPKYRRVKRTASARDVAEVTAMTRTDFRFADAYRATPGASPWHAVQNGWKNITAVGFPRSLPGVMDPFTTRAPCAGAASAATSAAVAARRSSRRSEDRRI